MERLATLKLLSREFDNVNILRKRCDELIEIVVNREKEVLGPPQELRLRACDVKAYKDESSSATDSLSEMGEDFLSNNSKMDVLNRDIVSSDKNPNSKDATPKTPFNNSMVAFGMST